MKRLDRTPVRACLVLLCGLQVGCSALTSGEPSSPSTPPPPACSPVGHIPEDQPAVLQRVRFTVAAVGESPAAGTAAPLASPALPFASQAELSAEALVGEVLARNPTLAQ